MSADARPGPPRLSGGFAVLAAALVVASGALFAAGLSIPFPRVGDPGSVFDPGRFDPRFPEMREWAKAGVRGGIPPRESLPVAARLAPGDDLQAAVDGAAAKGGGVVLLAPGRHRLTERLDMRSSVVLRGEDREGSIVEVAIRTDFHAPSEILGIRFYRIHHAALEDLTVLHPDVERMDPESYAAYDNEQGGVKDLYVGHLYVRGSEECWVDGCRLLCAGSDPVIVTGCRHVTLRDNVVDRSFNKGGRRNGYYLVMASDYVLCSNETVTGLRHFAIQEDCRYCVFLNSYLEVDLNFHAKSGEHNLVEGCEIRLPRRHLWWPIAHGPPRYPPPGKGNILYRLTAQDRDGGRRLSVHVDPETGGKVRVLCEPDAAYSVKESFVDPPFVHRLDAPPPRYGTFYPVTGRARPAAELARLHGTVRARPNGAPR